MFPWSALSHRAVAFGRDYFTYFSGKKKLKQNQIRAIHIVRVGYVVVLCACVCVVFSVCFFCEYYALLLCVYVLLRDHYIFVKSTHTHADADALTRNSNTTRASIVCVCVCVVGVYDA